MLSGLLKPVLSPLLSLATTGTQSPTSPATAPKPVAQSTTQPTVPTAASEPLAQPASSDGVRFDLSDAALQQIRSATQAPPPVASQASASEGPSAPQAPASDAPSRMGAAPVRADAPSDGGSSERAPERAADRPADPTEEARARAWAIRGMEREKLMGLIDTLKVTPKADLAQKEVAQQTAAQPQTQAAQTPERIAAA